MNDRTPAKRNFPNSSSGPSIGLLTVSHFFVLGLLALLFLFVHLLLTSTLENNRPDTTLVDVAGRQRMLSQKIAVHAVRLADDHLGGDSAEIRRHLHDAIVEMKQTHAILMRHTTDGEFLMMLLEPPHNIDLRMTRFLEGADRLNSESRPSLLHARKIVAAADELLPHLDEMVHQYAVNQGARLDRFIVLSRLLLAISLFGILFLGLVVFRPIIRRVRSQMDEIQAARRALSEANVELKRMDAMKDKFMMHAVHDMRTPLTAMIGAVEIIQTGKFGEVSDKQRDLLAMLNRSARRLSRLIEDILDKAAISAGSIAFRPTFIDLVAVVRDAERSIMPLFMERQRRLQIEVQSETIDIVGDETRLCQVLTNILGNAVRFAKGEVLLRVSRIDREIEIFVQDDGPGIPAGDLKRIFLPFEKVRGYDAASQTGLGLSIVQGIVELHQGRIWAENRPAEQGSGSRFIIRLPLLIRSEIPAEIEYKI